MTAKWLFYFENHTDEGEHCALFLLAHTFDHFWEQKKNKQDDHHLLLTTLSNVGFGCA